MELANNTTACQNFVFGYSSAKEFLDCSWGSPCLPVLVLLVWIVLLFIVLTVVADEFLSPAAVAISKCLGLSDSLAGVTLVAFGNGAPDVFSAFSGIKGDKSSMVFSQLYGSGLFVSALVVGIVMICVPQFSLDWATTTRDMIVYMLASIFTFYVYCEDKINLTHAAEFLVIYVVYIIIVAVWAKYVPSGRTSDLDEEAIIGNRLSNDPVPGAGFYDCPDPSKVLKPEPLSWSWERFKKKSWWAMMRTALALPLSLLIPVVDRENSDGLWCRVLNVVPCILTPPFFIYLIFNDAKTYGLPLGVGAVYVSAALGVILSTTFTSDTASRFRILFAVMGFAVSVALIARTCDSLVSSLDAIGKAARVPDPIMGFTLLSWGNSLGDLMTNVAIARHDHAAMAISAAFGGILLDMLLGLGLPFLNQLWKTPDGTVELRWSYSVVALFVGVMTSLIVANIGLWCNKWRASKTQGCMFVTLYFVTVIAAAVTSVAESPQAQLLLS